jgi:hypothetical protein
MIDSLPAKGSSFKAFNQAAQKEPKDTKEPLEKQYSNHSRPIIGFPRAQRKFKSRLPGA